MAICYTIAIVNCKEVRSSFSMFNWDKNSSKICLLNMTDIFTDDSKDKQTDDKQVHITDRRGNVLDCNSDKCDNTPVTKQTHKGRYKVKVVGLNFRLTSRCHPAMLSQFIMEFQRSVWSEHQISAVGFLWSSGSFKSCYWFYKQKKLDLSC